MIKQIILVLAIFLGLTACGGAASGEAETASVPTVVKPTATVRIVMIATDPATFERAAGQPQLVDFFAFW